MQEISFLSQYYENNFKLDEQMFQLVSHAMSELDRENRDTLAFYWIAGHMKQSSYFVPALVRVLIKIIDKNKNSSRFYQPQRGGVSVQN